MFRPANQASIRLYSSKENYTQSIALNRLAMNLGFTVGPMLGGFIASISYKFIFWADGVTCIFAALFLWLKLPYKKAENTSKTITEKDSVPFSRSPYRDKHYLLFILFTMIYALVFFQLLTTMSLYYENEYHLSERKIGTLLAVNGIGVAVVEMFLIYYIQNRWSNFKFISLGTLLVICSYLILVPFHGIWVLIIGILLITMSEMLAMPFMSTFALNRSDSSNVGRYMALYSMAWSTALILAPILGTQIIHSYGFNILFISLGILALIPLLGFRWLDIQLTNENLNTES
jgi:predicted MFS family arabinose efflux permease